MSQAHTVEHDQGIGGEKTIGFWGGFNLLANNICGPAIVLLPALFQQAGLIPTLVGLFVITFFCYICSWMLIEAMRLMPNNKHLTQRYEYMGLCEELLYKNHYWIIYVCYNISALSVLISNIIQTVQVMDIAISDIFGCSYGFEYYPNPFRFPCGNDVDNVEPFDDWVISIGFVIVALISIPFGILNLDDNIILQWIATVGFAIMAIMWVVIYCYQDTFSFDNIPWATWELSNLVGVILFNYGYIVTLPSWANETKVSTSTTNVLIFSLVFMLIEFIVVGLFGGWAYAPYYNSDNDLFNEMNEYSGLLAKITVYLEPIIQNLTSIPVFSIVIRYNLLNTGFNKFTANMWAIVFPWLVSIPLYNGNGFNDLCNWTGVIFAAYVNFIIPPWLYIMAYLKHVDRAKKAVIIKENFDSIDKTIPTTVNDINNNNDKTQQLLYDNENIEIINNEEMIVSESFLYGTPMCWAIFTFIFMIIVSIFGIVFTLLDTF